VSRLTSGNGSLVTMPVMGCWLSEAEGKIGDDKSVVVFVPNLSPMQEVNMPSVNITINGTHHTNNLAQELAVKMDWLHF
jgi:hypothetical protein